jgi:murein DD-endopeptidase MepM/ murein hydrolase activator NlpD
VKSLVLRTAVVSILIANTNVNWLAQAQNVEPPRKPMAESSLELPEYFGLYAVQESGQMLALDQPVQRLDERPTLSLSANVEFLVYGKDVDPSTLHLIVIPTAQPQRKQEQGNKQFSWDDFMQQTQVDGPENFMASMSGIPRGSAEGKLLVKPVGNQPQMLRLIPAGLLPNGIYQIGTPEKSWYRFVVGPMPSAQSVSQSTAQQPTRRAQTSQGGTQGDNVRTITLGDIMDAFKKPEKQGTLDPTPQNPPAASAKPSDVVSLVCRGAKLGEFKHGTKCTGFYGADGLVDIQLSGVASALPHEQTKELVHAGVDIIAGEGWKITPIRDGVVTDIISDEVDRDWRSLGYMVVVQHSADLESPMYSCYLHMRQAPSVKIGDAVVAGKTLLGRVGQTGAAFGSHIHVEVRTFKERFNPLWKNIYGKVTPESEKTFDENDFTTSWVDPVTFALQ